MLALAQLTPTHQQHAAGPVSNTNRSSGEFRYIKVRSGSIRSKNTNKETRVHVEDVSYYEFRRASLGSNSEDPTCAQFKVLTPFSFDSTYM